MAPQVKKTKEHVAAEKAARIAFKALAKIIPKAKPSKKKKDMMFK
jgi:hypothetical protein